MTPSPAANVSAAFVAQARHYLLREYFPKIKRCLEQLTDEQVWWRPNENSNSIGNLLLHLSGNVRQWIAGGVGGQAVNRDRDSEFAQREVISRDELLERLRNALSDVDSVLSNLDHSILLEHRKIQGDDVTVLEAIFHVTEHFSMHAGQIFLLTKLLTATDLRFYDFEAEVPVANWRSPYGSS